MKKKNIDLNEFIDEKFNTPEKKMELEKAYIASGIVLSIKRLRMVNCLSQSDLAEIIGTKQQVISRIEQGESNITVNMLIRISKAFGKKLKIDFV